MTKAAVVSTWGQPPIYQDITLPSPSSSQVRIKILAAGFHNLVRTRASGKHFSVAGKSPPHVPGVDGVGTVISTGELVYFSCLTAPTGSFAEEINVEKKDIYQLPDGADPDTIALLTNPAMSGWMGLTTRAGLSGEKSKNQGFSVAIIGATGVSGHAAVQVSKALGATTIIAIGKPGAKLDKTTQLGATKTIALGDDADFSPAADVDVVLDYLWGSVASSTLNGILASRKNMNQRLTWVEIGALAGDESGVSAAVLRKANIAFVGSGPGSWTFKELGEQLPKVLVAMVEGGMKAEYEVAKLSEVETWWSEEGVRKVVKP